MIRRFIDADSGELRKQITATPVVAETSKRGATAKLVVQFVRDGVVIELDPANTETVKIGFKAPEGYDSVAYVIDLVAATKSGTGTAAAYTFAIPFLSALLDQLLADNVEDTTLVPEIKWTSPNENGESLAFDWVVQNNVQRGGESVPGYPVIAATVRLPQVSRLTGGVLATDLDAQLLAGYPNGTVFEVVTTDPISTVRSNSLWEKDNTGPDLVTNLTTGRVIVCTDGTKLYGA